MTRPSRQIDRHLIEAGREVLKSKGATHLTLREVASIAHANLGMIHYHFKTKDQFLEAVLSELYEDFFSSLEKSIQDAATEPEPIDQLLKLLYGLGIYAIERKDLLSTLIKDLLVGNPVVVSFAEKNFPRHLRVIGQVLQKCQQVGQIRRDLTPGQLIMLCVSVLNIPVVFGWAFASSKPDSAFTRFMEKEILTRESLESRLKVLMRGLAPCIGES